jgi:flavin-dependent dehydrogenase
MVGDAAGMITPLCGNGMSMALHGSKIAATVIDGFLRDSLSRTAMEQAYIQQWQQQFAKRLAAGRFIQQFFGHNRLTDYFIQALHPFPGIVNYLVRKTHGMTF